MAYVRWSSEDFRSDFYIYAHVAGGFSVNLAGRRLRPGYDHADAPDMMNKPPLSRGFNPDWLAWDEEAHENIEHPDAGETQMFATLTETIAACEKWIEEGFYAPAWMIPRLQKEREEEGDENPPYEPLD